MTTRLTLICHAPTAATRAARFPSDEPLDTLGQDALARSSLSLRTRVATAGRHLAGPERRILETVDGLGVGLAFEPEAILRDQDLGRWAGRRLVDVAAAEPAGVAAWMADPAAAPHGGESVAGLLARVNTWMAEQAAVGGRVAAVTHPAVVRAAVIITLGAGGATFWRVEAPPLTAAVISHDGRRWTLVGLVPP